MIGQTILHYRIIEELGRGGMGVVYKAEDTRLKRDVAIKFLPRNIAADSEHHQRFTIEAQAAAALNHPNISHIYTIETFDDPAHGKESFIVMEYVDGQELKEFIRDYKKDNRQIPIEDILKIARQICQGIQTAHEKNIIHRDIKSANIMVMPQSGHRIKIMDFGLAKVPGSTQITQTGTTLGTISYMSPEQASGQEIDQRTDLWSLGVVLYELLSGHLPFQGDYQQAVIFSLLNEAHPPISDYREDVPPGLSTIVDKLLIKDPKDRYQNALSVLDDLNNISSTETSDIKKAATANGSTSPQSLPYFPLIAALFIAIAAFVFWPGKDKAAEAERRFQSIAVLPFADLSEKKDQEYFCDGMTEEILTKLAQLKNLKVIARTSVMRYKKSDKSIREIADELGVETVLEGSIRKFNDDIRITAQLIDARDESHLWAENYDRKFSGVFQLQEEISHSIAEALHIQLTPQAISQMESARPKDDRAYDYVMQGKYHIETIYAAKPDTVEFSKAMKLFDKALAADSTYGQAYTAISMAYHLRWVFTGHQDINALEQSRTFAEKGFALNPKSSYVNALLGMSYVALGQRDSGYRYLKQAFNLNTNEILAHHASAFLMSSLGLTQEGKTFMERRAELDPAVSASHTLLVGFQLAAGELTAMAETIRLLRGRFKDDIFAQTSADYRALTLQLINGDIAGAEEAIAKINSNREDLRFALARSKRMIAAAKGDDSVLPEEKLYPEILYILLKRPEDAITALKEKLTRPRVGRSLVVDSYYGYLQYNPFLASIRNHPEFQEMLRAEKAIADALQEKYGDLTNYLPKN